jgi:argininosuccinate lyase
VNGERMRGRLDGSLVAAVELAEMMVTDAGLSFREAYKLVAALVRGTIDRGGRLSELTSKEINEASREVLGKEVEITDALIAEATDPMASLMRRKSRGSPHPDQVRRMLEERGKTLKEYGSELNARRRAVDEALEALRNIVATYVS